MFQCFSEDMRMLRLVLPCVALLLGACALRKPVPAVDTAREIRDRTGFAVAPDSGTEKAGSFPPGITLERPLSSDDVAAIAVLRNTQLQVDLAALGIARARLCIGKRSGKGFTTQGSFLRTHADTPSKVSATRFEGFHQFASRGRPPRRINGSSVPATSAPAFRGNPERVDPEAAFVASLSSCHMLTFLAIASRKRLVVDAYEDDAVGYLAKNEAGKLAMTRVVLRPRVAFAGASPSPEALADLHELSHRECFIANSVVTHVEVEAQPVP